MRLLAKSREREDTVSDSEEDSDFANAFHRIAVNSEIPESVRLSFYIAHCHKHSTYE